MEQETAGANIAIGGSSEHAVEPVEELLQQAAALLLGPQEQRRQRRGQRQGDGQRELLVKPAGDARDERGGDEHRRQDDGDGHDRPGHFLHAFQCRLLGRQPVLDVVLHDLDDHDGVVHNQADGQHQPEE